MCLSETSITYLTPYYFGHIPNTFVALNTQEITSMQLTGSRSRHLHEIATKEHRGGPAAGPLTATSCYKAVVESRNRPQTSQTQP